MEISGQYRFAAPRAVIWDMLLDPAAIRAAIPGCEDFREVGPASYDISLRVGMAAIKGSYTGNVRVADRTEQESYRLVITGSGKPGSVQADALMTLSADGAGTRVSYAGQVRAQGAIARLGSRLLAGAAKLMIGQFFKGMEKQVSQRVA
ncbi:MAG: CoxG family protein [Tepidiformaceae bacterium]